MRKLLAAILMCVAFASPASAAKKMKQPHMKYDYRYHAPKYKYKAPKPQKHHSHPANGKAHSI